jgi:hypothetical protein
LITCAVWLYIANRYGLPVSDSQTTGKLQSFPSQSPAVNFIVLSSSGF